VKYLVTTLVEYEDGFHVIATIGNHDTSQRLKVVFTDETEMYFSEGIPMGDWTWVRTDWERTTPVLKQECVRAISKAMGGSQSHRELYAGFASGGKLNRGSPPRGVPPIGKPLRLLVGVSATFQYPFAKTTRHKLKDRTITSVELITLDTETR
jgi:hypothetical protein